ncbi:MAG TPA: patatin-like phospholipase family protein [Dongiaceae bacterium]
MKVAVDAGLPGEFASSSDTGGNEMRKQSIRMDSRPLLKQVWSAVHPGSAINSFSSRRQFWCQSFLIVLAITIAPLLQSCSAPERLPPVPTSETARAFPLGLANARFFPMLERDAIIEEWELSLQRQRATLGLAPDAQLPEAHFLAISGGGDNGAFGSGILVGWTEAGGRPEFQVVTGVSTGALIAPFAFLGPEYDPQLRAVYTTVSADDIYSERGFISGIFGDAMADTTPLYGLISKYVDEPLLAAIAREYKKGRLLLIGTTDLDAERANIWNIGAIAASGNPGALDLIRKILRASSAVPGFFQPVMIDVELDGKPYQELHVDGGAIAQMFLYPPSIDINKLTHRNRTAYLIRNAREDPEWQSVERQTLSIAGRAVSTMIHTSGTNDLLRIYFVTQRDGVDYNLAYIGSDFSHPEAGDFDKGYMNALFDYAYQQSRHGYSWKKVPPILANVQQ